MSNRDDRAAVALRVDRWLWCTRLFKTRSGAADAVRAGHVRLDGRRIKPAQDVKIGAALSIDRDGTPLEVEVAAIPSRRGPATEAQRCYIETAESIERRRLRSEQAAVAAAFRPPTTGRPDKRTRRLILRTRQRD